ncbi:TetR/AcrR family transcriptional regulator [Halovulum sp. GXIMD14794]
MDKKIVHYIPGSVVDLLQELVSQRPVAKGVEGLPNGDRTKRRILDGALSLFINARAEDFTMRNLANSLDMRVGNLTYHYRTKHDLLDSLVRDRLADYANEILICLQLDEATPQDALDRVVILLVQDLRRPEIAFFPQLWALSLHDATAARLMDSLHEAERQVISGLIGASKPHWPQTDCDALALHVTAAIEGLTLFIGQSKKSQGIYAAPEDEILRVLRRAM